MTLSFKVSHKIIGSSNRETIEVTLFNVPEYYPTGNKLSKLDLKKYVKQYYNFDVVEFIEDKS